MRTKDDLGLQPALQEVLNLETKNVIQLHPVIRQNTSPDKPPEEGIALKEPLGVLLLESEQLTSSGPDQGQAVLHAPDLTLVPQTVLSNELQLLVETSLLERPPWGRVHLGVLGWAAPIVAEGHHPYYFSRVSLVEVNQAIKAWSF